MRQCNDRTPANLISSLIRSLARKSPCWKVNHEYSAAVRPAPYIIINTFIIVVTVLFSLNDKLNNLINYV